MKVCELLGLESLSGNCAIHILVRSKCVRLAQLTDLGHYFPIVVFVGTAVVKTQGGEENYSLYG